MDLRQTNASLAYANWSKLDGIYSVSCMEFYWTLRTFVMEISCVNANKLSQTVNFTPEK